MLFETIQEALSNGWIVFNDKDAIGLHRFEIIAFGFMRSAHAAGDGAERLVSQYVTISDKKFVQLG